MSAEIASIHLQLDGQQRTVPVTFQPGQKTVGELLPIARELAHHITAMAIESAEGQGRAISCKAGCGACCRQLVCISLVEAQALAELIATLPPERQALIRGRFASALRRLEAAGLLDPNGTKGSRRLASSEAIPSPQAIRAVAARYFEQQIACPFLESESCSIYSERPLVCREYHVTSPAERCSRLYEIGVDPLDVPVRMSDCLVQVGHQIAAASKEAIPLVLALEWAQAHPKTLSQRADSLEMLKTMMGHIDEQCSQGFDKRGDDKEVA